MYGKRSMDNSLVIFLHSSRYDRLYQAVNLLLTASSMGWRCHLYLFFDALASFMAGKWDEVNLFNAAGGGQNDLKNSTITSFQPPWTEELQTSLESANFPSLYRLLEKSQNQELPVQIYACSTSVRLLNLDTREVKTRVGDIVGLSTMLQIAAGTKHVIYI